MLALRDLLQPDHITAVARVGEIDGNGPYQRMLEEGLCTVAEVVPFPDYIHISAGGAELATLQGRPEGCAHAVAVQTRVYFLSAHQPPFGVVDTALRGMGFLPHCFAEAVLMPILTEPQLQVEPHQLADADIVYVRDWNSPDHMGGEQWKQLALVAHHILGSYDLAYHAVCMAARRGDIEQYCPERYRAIVSEHL